MGDEGQKACVSRVEEGVMLMCHGSVLPLGPMDVVPGRHLVKGLVISHLHIKIYHSEKGASLLSWFKPRK